MKPHRFVRPLTPEERIDLDEVLRRRGNASSRKRAQAVRLNSLGVPVPDIAVALNCNPQSVHNWLNLFEAGGCDALFDRPRSGRPPSAGEDYRPRLVEAAGADPTTLGYPFGRWTYTRLRTHVAQKTGVLLSESRVRQILKEEGLMLNETREAAADCAGAGGEAVTAVSLQGNVPAKDSHRGSKSCVGGGEAAEESG